MSKIDDGGPAFAAWNGSLSYMGNGWVWGRIIKRTAKTATIQQWREWGGGAFEPGAGWRKSIGDCVLFAKEDDARALVAAIKDLNDREDATRRQYDEKRRALIAAARTKGGAA